MTAWIDLEQFDRGAKAAYRPLPEGRGVEAEFDAVGCD
jgi:hypothetical protein